MDQHWILLVGIAVGWGLTQVANLFWYKAEKKGRRLSTYQQALAYVEQLRESVPRAKSFAAIRPLLDNFRQWHYYNNLSLNPRTNTAIVGVINRITSNMLPSPRANNILVIDDVQNAFLEAESAIRTATG